MSVAALVKHEGFSVEQVELIKTQIAKGCTNDELQLFMATAERLGLDPFAKEIYALKRWQNGKEQMVIQVAIDGYRKVASRTGDYEGQTHPQWWDKPTKQWVDVWDSEEHPTAARVGVWRKGFREPMYGVVRFSAYAQRKKDGSLNTMWAKMDAEMLVKCAEALGLRKAFPQLSGTYTPEEMDQAENLVYMAPQKAIDTTSEPASNSDEREQVRVALVEEINNAPSLEELAGLVERISEQPESIKAILRKAYKARTETLKGAA